MSSTERDPLLQRALHEDAQRQTKADDEHRHRTRRALAACACLTLFVVALVVCLGIWEATADDGGIGIGDGWGVEAVLRRSPVIVRFRCSLLNFLDSMLSLLTISWFCFGTICELIRMDISVRKLVLYFSLLKLTDNYNLTPELVAFKRYTMNSSP